MNISDIKRANREAGRFWFSPATLRFFESRILPSVYEGPGGIYFITSEQGPHGPRAYTVRRFFPGRATIGTVGPFNESTLAECRKLARASAKGVEVAADTRNTLAFSLLLAAVEKAEGKVQVASLGA